MLSVTLKALVYPMKIVKGLALFTIKFKALIFYMYVSVSVSMSVTMSMFIYMFMIMSKTMQHEH